MISKQPTAYLICETGMDATKPAILKSDKDVTTINVTLQDADTLNRNKRIYPKSVLENALKAPYVQERLMTKTWYGEAGRKDCRVE